MDQDIIVCGENCKDDLIPLMSLTEEFRPRNQSSENSKLYHIPTYKFIHQNGVLIICYQSWSCYSDSSHSKQTWQAMLRRFEH